MRRNKGQHYFREEQQYAGILYKTPPLNDKILHGWNRKVGRFFFNSMSAVFFAGFLYLCFFYCTKNHGF